GGSTGSTDYLGNLLNDALLDVCGPEHLGDIDQQGDTFQQDRLGRGHHEVLDELADPDLDGEVIRLTRENYRERPIGRDDVAQDTGFLCLDDCSFRCGRDLGLVSVRLEVLLDLHAQGTQLFVLSLKPYHFLIHHIPHRRSGRARPASCIRVFSVRAPRSSVILAESLSIRNLPLTKRDGGKGAPGGSFPGRAMPAGFEPASEAREASILD